MDKNIQELVKAILESTADMPTDEQEFFINYTLFCLSGCTPYLIAEISGDTERGRKVPELFSDSIYYYIENDKINQRGLAYARR